MSPPDSFLWTLCNGVRLFVEAGLQAALNDIHVSIGSPALNRDDADANQVNLFFYRFEPSGFEAEAHPQEPWRLRLSCLVTALGAGSGEELAGDNDLRLLGNVIRIFHQTPILEAMDVDGETVRLQAVFVPLSGDTINQVWSTQGDATYRPSVAYELSLAPVVPSVRRMPPSTVGAIGSQAAGEMGARHRRFAGGVQTPPVPVQSVDLNDPDWQPLLCWVVGTDCHRTYSHDVAEGPFAPLIWVAGDPTASLDLSWERWDSSSGWTSIGTSAGVVPFGVGIDPDAVPEPLPASFTQVPPEPLGLPPNRFSRQYMVYARRIGGSGLEVRSEPLLLTLHRARPS
jgi:hypothetical protein